jgi:UDP-N-acetyl-D-mannosaminuronate dehydrogenase
MRAHRKRLEGRVAAPAPVPDPAPVEPQPAELPRTPARPQAVPVGAGAHANGSTFSRDVAVIAAEGRAAVPLGLAFAKAGLSVVLHDTDAGVVDLVNRGKAPLRSGAERSLLRGALREGRISASADVQSVAQAECLMLVLGAAERVQGDVEASVVEVLESIKDGLRDGQLLVLENNLDPVVAQRVEDVLTRVGRKIDVAQCRERGGPSLPAFSAVPQILSGRTPEALKRAERLFRVRNLPQRSRSPDSETDSNRGSEAVAPMPSRGA